MIRPSVLSALVLICALLPSQTSLAANASDRLDRFRTLAATRLSLADVSDPARAAEAYREVLALLDEEIVESLASGSFFASLAFLQDRLDGLAEVWGGAALRLSRVGPLTVGAYYLGHAPGGSSVRVYGVAHGEAQLLSALRRDGRPSVHPLPPAPDGSAQFAAVWEGEAAGRGTHPLRLDLVRQRGDDVTVVWSTADAISEAMMARGYQLRGRDLRVRYALRYPGWIPGCAPQTEQEDVFHLAPESGTFVRVSRTQHNAWHRALHRAVASLLDALAAGDRAALATLVPDAELRARLPASLTLAPACDAPDGPEPATVSVAASGGEQGPWALTFRRRGGEWGLAAATPVLQ